MTFSVYLRAISWWLLLLLLLLHYHLLPECTLSNRWLFKLFCVGLKGSLTKGGADRGREGESGGTGSTLAAIFIKFLLWLLQQLRHDVDELFMAGSLEGVPRSHSSSLGSSSFSLSCMQHNISPIIIIIIIVMVVMVLVIIMILLMHLRNPCNQLCVSPNRFPSCLRVPPICLATFNDLFMGTHSTVLGFLFNR